MLAMPHVVTLAMPGDVFMRTPFIRPATIELEFGQHVASTERDEDVAGALGESDRPKNGIA